MAQALGAQHAMPVPLRRGGVREGVAMEFRRWFVMGLGIGCGFGVVLLVGRVVLWGSLAAFGSGGWYGYAPLVGCP